MDSTRPLAIVTGASAGIGYELAKLCAQDGYDLVVAADDAKIQQAASELRAHGGDVQAVQADLATTEGVDQLVAAARGRPVGALLANAGHGLGKGFLDQDWRDARHVVDTNVTGTLYLVHTVGRQMRQAGRGRILITGSIAGYMPGAFQAVYNGTKAFIDSFAGALREELRDTGVTVTLLMPGATETEFFDRAGMQDTKVGSSKKDDPAMVARVGYDAMKRGQGDVVSGFKNKVQSTIANLTPGNLTAAQHRKMAEPGSGRPRPRGGLADRARDNAGPLVLLGLAAAGLVALSGPARRAMRHDDGRQNDGRTHEERKADRALT